MSVQARSLCLLVFIMSTVVSQGLVQMPYDCDKPCPVPLSERVYCYSDGNVYPSKCFAECKDSSLKKRFSCIKNNDLCKSGCVRLADNKSKDKDEVVTIVKTKSVRNDSNGDETTDNTPPAQPVKFPKNINPAPRPVEPTCEEGCRKRLGDRMACYSNGSLYINQCYADCAQKSLTKLFICKSTKNHSICQDRCHNSLNDCPKCYNEPRKEVCGLDGRLYKNECQAACKSGGIFYEIENPHAPRVKHRCERNFHISQCVKQCDSQGLPVCTTIGIVYENSCVAACARRTVKYECNNEIFSCMENCRN